jgi:uncharacterized membrane protein (DUF485 family)
VLHSENQVERESDAEIARRQRAGLILLAVFSVIYFGFIGLCAFANTWFSNLLWMGVPVPVWYGASLIVLALAIAGIYGRFSRSRS